MLLHVFGPFEGTIELPIPPPPQIAVQSISLTSSAYPRSDQGAKSSVPEMNNFSNVELNMRWVPELVTKGCDLVTKGDKSFRLPAVQVGTVQ